MPSMTTPAAIEPLPPNSFVFWRAHVRQDVNAWRAQIWTYNVDSKQQRLVTDLDNNVSFDHLAGGLELSPDRKWVAYSAFFRTPQDPYSVHTNLIWKVSVDGKQFVQVTPLPADPRQRCDAQTPCTQGSADKVCEEGRCTPFAWRYTYERPRWAPDSQTLLFHLVEQYCLMAFCKNWNLYPPGPWVVSASVAFQSARPGSEPKQLPTPALKDCGQSNPMLKPDGKRLALNFRCPGPEHGILVSDPDGSNASVVLKGLTGQMEWLPESDALYYVTTDNKRLIRLNVTDNTQQVILDTQPDDPLRIGHIAISPNGKWLFFSQNLVNSEDTNLYLTDLTTPTVEILQITNDGGSSL